MYATFPPRFCSFSPTPPRLRACGWEERCSQVPNQVMYNFWEKRKGQGLIFSLAWQHLSALHTPPPPLQLPALRTTRMKRQKMYPSLGLHPDPTEYTPKNPGERLRYTLLRPIASTARASSSSSSSSSMEPKVR